ncbi:hypothetical protein [Capnocytophaga canis]|uniref:hypothetical protein n=1 Tax=Capnocytophaga canis TaxID=1848903 RepID=UPI0037D21CED
MRANIVTRWRKLCVYISQKWLAFWRPPVPTYDWHPLLSRPSICDAELERCKEALSPLGYTLSRQLIGNEIVLCRQMSLEEQKKELERLIRIFELYI